MTPLRDEELVALLPGGDAPVPREIAPADLVRYPLILENARSNLTRLILEWLAQAGAPPRPAMEVDNVEAIKHSVAAGLGAAIVPRVAVGGTSSVRGLVVRPLRPPLARTIGVIQRRDKPDEPALRHVRSALLALAGDEPPASVMPARPAGRRARGR